MTTFFTAAQVLADAEGFGTEVTDALIQYRQEGNTNNLFDLIRALNSVTQFAAETQLRALVLKLFPEAVGVSWNVYYYHDIREGFSVSLSSVNFADGKAVCEMDGDEDDDILNSWAELEENFSGFIYSLDRDTIENETLVF